MSDDPSTSRRGRSATAPSSEPLSNPIIGPSITCDCSKKAASPTPAATNTDNPAATQEATCLPAQIKLANPEPTTPEQAALELAAESPCQGPLKSVLGSFQTDEERAAARVGWIYAAAKATNDALVEQYAGRKPELVAANKGWKTCKMVDAHNRGLETFWCEKAPECILDQFLRTDSRPCVSNYFGRNKRNTARIPNMITWCRKHYQRSGYRGPKNPNNNLEWPREKAGLILEQLRRNESGYFQDTQEHLCYTVSLKKSEQDRVNYHNNHQGQSPDPNSKAKSFEAPISVLLHIFNTYVGEHKSYEECCTLTNWAESKLSKETCRDLPLWEMVPEYPNFEDMSAVEEDDEDDDDDDEDMEDDDIGAGPVTPKKRSPKKAIPKKKISPKKITPKKSTPRKSPTNIPSRSHFKTRASSAKPGRVTEQGSIQKTKVEE